MALTDRKAIRLALNIAIDTEESLIDAYDNNAKEESVKRAKQNIAAFKRVLDRYFGGRRPDPLAKGKFVSLTDLLKGKWE